MPSDSDTSSLLTLSDSVLAELYHYVGDRRYQASTEGYVWPCDGSASQLEIVMCAMFEKLYGNKPCWEPHKGALEELLVSSVDGPPRLLDLGECSGATASWAISMAQSWPKIEIIGVDLIPCDVTYLPPNLTIEVADLFEGLPYPDAFFSLLHARCPGAGKPTFFENPSLDFLSECARVLRPGGVLLLEDVDNLPQPLHTRAPPPDPYLDLMVDRHTLRWTGDPRNTSDGAGVGVSNWGSRMRAEVEKTEAWNDATISEAALEIPLGVREGYGPPESQFGALAREAWLLSWALQGAAQGWDDERIAKERKRDERALPEKDVGIYVVWNVVWAQEGGRDN